MTWPNSHRIGAKLRVLSSGSPPGVFGLWSLHTGTTFEGLQSRCGAACLPIKWWPVVAGRVQRVPCSSIETQTGFSAISVLTNFRQGALSSALSIGEVFLCHLRTGCACGCAAGLHL